MLSELPKDLQNVVFRFAYDANLEQVKEALSYLIFLNELKIHHACLRQGVFDFSRCGQWLYDRNTKRHRGYLAPWAASRVDSPFRSFFVWFSIDDLYDTNKMCWLVTDMDFRSTKHLFKNFPLKPCRNYKARIKHYIHQNPESSAISLTPIFRNLTNQHLNLHTSSLGRFVASDHCDVSTDWKLFSVILV